jgi:hypothetical protein
MKLEFSLQIFEKYSNIESNKNPGEWEKNCCLRKDRQTDRHMTEQMFVSPNTA